MKLFRHGTVTRIFSLFTGLIFLNMSFFLAEVCLISFQDRQMIENICNLMLNGGLEEERDTHATDTPAKLFSMVGENLQFRHSALFLIAEKVDQDFRDHYVHADHSETFSPPPDTSRV
jgi:hypothetical protein